MPTPSPLSRRLLGLTFAALVLATLIGCSKDPMNAASVKGKVFLDGQPLTKGSVRFVPDKSKGNTAGVEPVGTIGATGEYELITNGKPGAPLGSYFVCVVSGEIPDSSKPFDVPKGGPAPRFAQPETSKLAVDVVAAPADGAYDLKVSAK